MAQYQEFRLISRPGCLREAVGGTGCHASDVGNSGEVHCLEDVGGRLAMSMMTQFSSQESRLAVCALLAMY